MGEETICKVRHTVGRGDSVSKIFLDRCDISNSESHRLSAEWARQISGDDSRIYNLEKWAQLVQQRSPALSRLPIAQVMEVVRAEAARKLGVNTSDIPEDFQFVLARDGEEVAADVTRDADGKLHLNTHVAPKSYGDSSQIYGCFPGAVFLRLKNGEAITFEQLAAFEPGNPLPEVACWDAKQLKMIYQQPLAVKEHHYETPEHLAELTAQSGTERSDKITLKVTPNHTFLTADKNSPHPDIAAGSLKKGNALVNPSGGTTWRITSLNEFSNTVARDVYSLSLVRRSDPDTRTPYYLVSPDGENWLVAHNVTVKI